LEEISTTKAHIFIKVGLAGGHEQGRVAQLIYIIEEFVQPKMSLNREFLIWKERGRGWEG
jgi:hypothetical protein